MSTGKKIWSTAWRILVCLVLLGWIFHAIFTNEAKLAAAKNGFNWSELSRLQQWEQAWRLGPTELWNTVSSVHPGAFIVSILLVGMTILFGIIRWRMVLAGKGLIFRSGALRRFPSSRSVSIPFSSARPEAI